MVIRMSFPFGHSVSCIKEENTGVSLVISDKITIFVIEKVATWPPFVKIY